MNLKDYKLEISSNLFMLACGILCMVYFYHFDTTKNIIFFCIGGVFLVGVFLSMIFLIALNWER